MSAVYLGVALLYGESVIAVRLALHEHHIFFLKVVHQVKDHASVGRPAILGGKVINQVAVFGSVGKVCLTFNLRLRVVIMIDVINVIQHVAQCQVAVGHDIGAFHVKDEYTDSRPVPNAF